MPHNGPDLDGIARRRYFKMIASDPWCNSMVSTFVDASDVLGRLHPGEDDEALFEPDVAPPRPTRRTSPSEWVGPSAVPDWTGEE